MLYPPSTCSGPLFQTDWNHQQFVETSLSVGSYFSYNEIRDTAALVRVNLLLF